MPDNITPATMLAISGIADNSALQPNHDISDAISSMDTLSTRIETLYGRVAHGNLTITSDTTLQYIRSNVKLNSSLNLNNSVGLTTFNSLSDRDKLYNQSHTIISGICSYFSQALSHVKMAETIKKSTNFLSNVSFSDFGSGISNMSSLTDQGISSSFSNVTAVSETLVNAGQVFDISNMATFGTAGGLIQSMIKNKLGNHTGVVQELNNVGVDINQVNDRAYNTQVMYALQQITDTQILSTVTDQFNLTKSINSLTELLDISFYTNSPDLFPNGWVDITVKLKDLGISFKKTTDVPKFFNAITAPNTPLLDTADLSTISTSIQSGVSNKAMTGTGSQGLPTIQDFMSTTAANVFISEFSTITNTYSDTIQQLLDTIGDPPSSPITITDADINGTADYKNTLDRLYNQIKYVDDLFLAAGVDLHTSIRANTLTIISGFATSLHTYGETELTSQIISEISNTSTSGGQAIIASLTEGKNKSVFQSAGSRPITYS